MPLTKRDRSDWAERVADKIAARIREFWEVKRKPPAQIHPSTWSGWNMGPGKDP